MTKGTQEVIVINKTIKVEIQPFQFWFLEAALIVLAFVGILIYQRLGKDDE